MLVVRLVPFNVTRRVSRPADGPPEGYAYLEKTTDLQALTMKTLVELYNAFAGDVTPVKRFADRPTALQRVAKVIPSAELIQVPFTPEPEAAPVSPTPEVAMSVTKKTPKAKTPKAKTPKAAKPAKIGPRKAAQTAFDAKELVVGPKTPKMNETNSIYPALVALVKRHKSPPTVATVIAKAIEELKRPRSGKKQSAGYFRLKLRSAVQVEKYLAFA